MATMDLDELSGLPLLRPLEVELTQFAACALCPYVLECDAPELPEETDHDMISAEDAAWIDEWKLNDNEAAECGRKGDTDE